MYCSGCGCECEDNANLIMERKLNLFQHICRMGYERLVKTIVFGRMDGNSVRGRPLDDITDWCDMEVHELS